MHSQPSTLRSYPRPPISSSNRTPQQFPPQSSLKPPRPIKFSSEQQQQQQQQQSIPHHHHHHQYHQSNPYLRPHNEQTKKYAPSNQYRHHQQYHSKPQQWQQQQKHHHKQVRAQLPQRKTSPANHADLLKQFKMKRYMADMNLNVCMMKNKSRSPSPATHQKKIESKEKNQRADEEDEQKDDSKERENLFKNKLEQQNITEILQSKNNLNSSKKEELKSPQFNQAPNIDFQQKQKSGIINVDIDDSINQDDGAFSQIGGGIGGGARHNQSKEERKQKIKSPSSQQNKSQPGKATGKSNYLMDIDLSKLSADLAITKKPISPPVHVNLSPQKRKQRQENFIIGSDILVRVETNALFKVFFDIWVKNYQERKQLMKQRIKIFLEKVDSIKKARHLKKWRKQNHQQKRDQQNHQKMLKFVSYRQAVKMKYVLHNMRRFSICQKRWIQQTRENFDLSRKKEIICSLIQFRNAEKAIKYLNSLKLRRMFQQGFVSLLRQRYKNQRKCVHFWSHQNSKKGLQSWKRYIRMRKMKFQRVQRALKFRERQVGLCILDIWKGKLAEKLAIKKDKLLTLAQSQNFLNIQFTKTVITKRNPMITGDENVNNFNDGIQKYEQIKLALVN